MSDTFTSLNVQRENIRTSIRLIKERMSKYVLGTDIPLDLERELNELELTLVELDARSAILKKIDSPYQGLNPFAAKDAANFFGRDAITAELAADVKRESIVAVVGRSGSGKSSLVLCGLLKQLQAEGLLDDVGWRVAVCKPGSDPINALSLALQEHLEPTATSNRQMELARTLTKQLLLPVEKGGLSITEEKNRLTLTEDVIPTLQRLYTRCKTLLLVIDQFEELFTGPSTAATRTQYIDFLLELAATRWVKIAITLRADYYDSLFQYPQMIRVAKQFNVYPMTAEELREAIEKPADATGRSFEEGLVSRILDDIANSPGDLALLEFTLTRLWEYQTASGLFTHAAYEAIGEVSGAIAQHADKVLGEIGDNLQDNARRLFQRLVRIQPQAINFETAARVTVSIGDLDAATRSLALDILTTNRLVVTGRGETKDAGDPSAEGDRPGTVELVHDALIRHWAKLQDWLREDAQWLIIRQELTAQVELWERYGEEGGLLYEGRRLRECLAVVAQRPEEFSLRELRFLQKSEEKERRRLLIVRGGYALALIALAIVGWILWIRPPAVPAATVTPIPMPANNFNVAMARFVVEGDATAGEAADLGRHASAVAEDVAAFFVDNSAALEEQFGTNVSLLDSARITLTTDTAGQLLVSASELSGTLPISSLRANVLIYGYLRKGQGRQWLMEPRFSLSNSQSTLSRAKEILGEYELGAPILFIPSSFTSERVRIRAAMEARLRTLLVMVRGLDSFDRGTAVGFQEAAGIFCPIAMNDTVADQYENIDLLYLFCGHALSGLLDIQRGDDKQVENGELAQRVINAYETGIKINPRNLRLQASFASQLIRRNQPDPECKQGNPLELERAKNVLLTIINDADNGAFLPSFTRQEVLFMLGMSHFWTGHCTPDMEKKIADFEAAKNYLHDSIDFQAPDIRTDIKDFVAGKAYSYLGYLFLILYSKYNQDPMYDYIGQSTVNYDESLQIFRQLMPDTIAYDYAHQILPSALMAFCLAQHPELAQEHLSWLIRDSPDTSREAILSQVPLTHQEKQECGL